MRRSQTLYSSVHLCVAVQRVAVHVVVAGVHRHIHMISIMLFLRDRLEECPSVSEVCTVWYIWFRLSQI